MRDYQSDCTPTSPVYMEKGGGKYKLMNKAIDEMLDKGFTVAISHVDGYIEYRGLATAKNITNIATDRTVEES
jgi:hypothetical protein